MLERRHNLSWGGSIFVFAHIPFALRANHCNRWAVSRGICRDLISGVVPPIFWQRFYVALFVWFITSAHLVMQHRDGQHAAARCVTGVMPPVFVQKGYTSITCGQFGHRAFTIKAIIEIIMWPVLFVSLIELDLFVQVRSLTKRDKSWSQ